jgi:hypothetical protein
LQDLAERGFASFSRVALKQCPCVHLIAFFPQLFFLRHVNAQDV